MLLWQCLQEKFNKSYLNLKEREGEMVPGTGLWGVQSPDVVPRQSPDIDLAEDKQENISV